MNDNVYERIHNMLTWKRIIAFNLFLFLVLVVPMSVRLTQIDTENRSNASENETTPIVTPPPAYPAENPSIERVREFYGKKGDTVILIGKNFGDYQWESKLFVGNVQVGENDIVRWSNSIIEVQIPENTRGGEVWVVIDGKQAKWNGNLLLTDMGRVIEMGISKEGNGKAMIWVTNAAGVDGGVLEIGFTSEPISINLIVEGSIANQTTTVDTVGHKQTIEFSLNTSLTSNYSKLVGVEYPASGGLEIVRAELYNKERALLNINIEPTNIKVN